jgi:hypothetical protein
MKTRFQVERKMKLINSELKRLSKRIRSGKGSSIDVKRYVDLNNQLLILYWVIE